MSGTDEVEDRLYGLLELAERQQAAAQAALEGVVAERAALKRERAEWAAAAKALGLSLRTEVRSAVADGLADAATEGVQAVETATAPLLGRLEGVSAMAGRAEAALRRVVLWASWRLLGWTVAMVAALVLWWDTGAITSARAQGAVAGGSGGAAGEPGRVGQGGAAGEAGAVRAESASVRAS